VTKKRGTSGRRWAGSSLLKTGHQKRKKKIPKNWGVAKKGKKKKASYSRELSTGRKNDFARNPCIAVKGRKKRMFQLREGLSF